MQDKRNEDKTGKEPTLAEAWQKWDTFWQEKINSSESVQDANLS